jgi:hypothetical protein
MQNTGPKTTQTLAHTTQASKNIDSFRLKRKDALVIIEVQAEEDLISNSKRCQAPDTMINFQNSALKLSNDEYK